MNLNNFYSGFGILLVYFTLIWQTNRKSGLAASEKATELIASISASEDDKKQARKNNRGYLSNPLNLTMDIISLAGLFAFALLIIQNRGQLGLSVSTIVLFSIALMHLVISVDLWRLNLKLYRQIKKLRL